jgi:hypothetical protein
MPKKISINKKIAAILVLSLLIISIAVGTTVAYIVKSTEATKNNFVPVYVDSAPVYKSNGSVAINNIGEVPAYLRATVVVNWVLLDADGNATDTHHSQTPVEGIDYTVTYDTTGAWLKLDDGFWYHRTPVGAGATTETLLSAITKLTEAPDGYRLSVEILSTGIQSTPIAAVEEAWGVTVDGIVIVK